MRKTLGAALTAVLAITFAALTLAAPAQADDQTLVPLGANNWSCKPNAAHPQPVVLVNGTFETMIKNWSVLSPQLANAGYCVYAFNYGDSATAPVAQSAEELDDFVRTVRAATGARDVDLVGHSQGGMMPRYWMRFLGGARYVDDLVQISPSNHGTTNPLAVPLGFLGVCDACGDQVAGSPLIQQLNAAGDTDKGVDYTVLVTRYDEVVTPYTSQFLSGSSDRVTNVLLQDKCLTDLFEHDQTPNDPVVKQWVLNALSTEGPANPGFRPLCL